MHKTKFFLSTLLMMCALSNSAMAQLLEVKSELDERAISIKVRDGVPSSRVIVSSSLTLSYSSNMGDITDEEVGYGSVNGLNSDTLYFFLAPEDPKRIVTISAEGYPPIDVPFTFSPKETYRCMVYDPNKQQEEEASPAANTANWQYAMAQNFDFGKDGFNEDEVESLNWYEKAADQGHGLAQVTLGVKYASGGTGFAKDAVKSARWFLIAAQQNYDTAQYAIANCFLQGNGVKQDLSKAYDWFQQAAGKGIDEARYQMARMVLDGFGSENQIKDLMSWFEFFANENRPEAQYMYAKLLLSKPSPENNQKAIEYLNKAIALSNIDAMLLLGGICFDKSYDQYNIIKGMELLRMAEKLGSNNATKLIESFDQSLTDTERFTYTKHFAESGNADDMVRMANMYYYGLGTLLDYDAAMSCFIKALGNNTDAYTGMALCYYYGHGVGVDYKEAFDCFSQGIANDNPVALSGLGMCYFYGRGVEEDAAKAYELFVKANNGTDGTALNGLGLCLFYGRPVMQDKAKAKELFEKALEFDQYNAGLSLGDYYAEAEEVDVQKVKDNYTLAAAAGNPEAQNKLGAFIIDCGYKMTYEPPKKGSDTEVAVLLPPTKLEVDEAQSWFKICAESGSLKGEYNYAYSYVLALSEDELAGSAEGQQAVLLFRDAAQRGCIEAMVALGAYYKYNLGISLSEAYSWLNKAIEMEGEGANSAKYNAFLGAMLFDEADTIAQIEECQPLDIYGKAAALMVSAVGNGFKYLHPRIYVYYKEVLRERRTAKEWSKQAELIPEFEMVAPAMVEIQH